MTYLRRGRYNVAVCWMKRYNKQKKSHICVHLSRQNIMYKCNILCTWLRICEKIINSFFMFKNKGTYIVLKPLLYQWVYLLLLFIQKIRFVLSYILKISVLSRLKSLLLFCVGIILGLYAHFFYVVHLRYKFCNMKTIQRVSSQRSMAIKNMVMCYNASSNVI